MLPRPLPAPVKGMCWSAPENQHPGGFGWLDRPV